MPLNPFQLLQPQVGDEDNDDESSQGGHWSVKKSIKSLHTSQTIENLERFCAFKPQVLANLRFGILIVNAC
jgi:hypothetical protein